MTKQKNIGLYETYIWILISFFLTLGYSSLGNSSFIQYNIFYTLSFVLLLFGSIYLMSGYDEICGKTDPMLTIYSVLYPFSFIFLVGISFLEIFPGWIRGFSNTFGSWVINLGGFKEFSFKLLAERSLAGQQQPVLILEKIYNNPFILFNELTLDNYTKTTDPNDSNNIKIEWTQLDNLINSGLIKKTISSEEKTKLADYIFIKNLIGKYIWYSLLSIITFFISINNLLNSDKCMDKVSDDVSEFKEYLSTQIN